MNFYNPNPYQQMYSQPMQDQLAQLRQPYQQMQNQYHPSNNSSVIWVQGEEGAKAYMVAPNNSVLLMDSEHSTFYLKSCDQSGMPSLRVFDYTERASRQPSQPHMAQPNEYVTREEYMALVARLDALQAFKEENANG